jgi:hypothetical protein
MVTRQRELFLGTTVSQFRVCEPDRQTGSTDTWLLWSRILGCTSSCSQVPSGQVCSLHCCCCYCVITPHTTPMWAHLPFPPPLPTSLRTPAPAFSATGKVTMYTEWQQLRNLLTSSVLLHHKYHCLMQFPELHNRQWQPVFPPIICQWWWVLNRMLITPFFKAVASNS